jgi:hypothetical protein
MSRFSTFAPPFEQAIPAAAAAVLTSQQLVQVLCLLPCTLLLLTRFRCRIWYPCIPPCNRRCGVCCRVFRSNVQLHSRAPLLFALQLAAEAERQRKIREEEERKAAAKVLLPATALPRPNVIRFAGCCRLSHQRQTRHLRSSDKRRLVSCSGPLDRRPFLRWPPRSIVSAVCIERRADDVLTRVFHEPKLCLLIHLFFSRNTPLMYSAAGGSVETCRVLVASKADVAAREWYRSPWRARNLPLTPCVAAAAELHSDTPSTSTRPTLLHTLTVSARRNDAAPPRQP